MIPWLLAAALATETPLVLSGDTWTYWDQGTQPPAGWNDVGFDDTTWGSGPSPLGYGTIGIVTTVGYGPDVLNRYVTTWFRKEFVATGTNTFTGVSLLLRRDDGAVVYINGVEVARTNMPNGPITASTLATGALNGLVEQELVRIPIPAGSVVDGDNVLAVEIHQAAVTSSDIALDATMSGWDDAGQVIRGPYLQSNTDDGVVVKWRTEGPVPSRVWIGNTPGALNQPFDGAPLALDHEVRISGLAPSTTRYYGVGSPTLGILEGDDFDHVFTTSPTPGTRQPVRLWFVGDAGTANANQEAVRDAYIVWSGGVDPDLFIQLGDNAYNSGTDDEYQAAVFDIYTETLWRVPTWSTLGNHDGYTASSITGKGPYYDIFTFPAFGEAGGMPSGTEAYFSWDYANIHFVNLDSYGSDRSVGGAMLTWLEADLAANTSDWVIAIWHHPPYSKGSHDSDFETELVQMRENALPILEGYGVDVVLSGHSHSYERSWLLDQEYGDSTTFDRQHVQDDGDGDPLGDGYYRKPNAGMSANEGAVYVVAGSSGKISGGQLNHPVMHLSLSVLGSVAITVDGDALDAVFVDDLGAEIDRFSIRKGVATITEIAGARSALEGEPLSFTAAGQLPDGTAITTFDWSFGDGTPDALGTDAVVHTWPGEGLWQMTVTALDETGTPFSEIAQVDILNGPPVLDPLVAPVGCQEGTSILWSASATDPGGDPIDYTWDFGDGTELIGQSVWYALGDDGPHTITLTATDDAGASDEAQVEVTCDNLPPIYIGLAHPPLVQLTPLTITALYTDPGRDDTVTVDWELDGAPPAQGDSFEWTFPGTGNFALRLTFTDDDGGQTVIDRVLTVSNGPPVLDALAVPPGIGEGELVNLQAIAHEAANEPFTVEWDFGDGDGAVGSAVSHAWDDDGVYTVTVVLDDGTDGGRAEFVTDVVVENRPAVVLDVVVPGTAFEGFPVALVALVDDPGASDALTVTWDLAPWPLTGEVVSWTPTGWGVAEGVVSVVDDEGLGESRPFAVSVANSPPAFSGLPDDTQAWQDEPWTWKAEASDPGKHPLTWDLAGPDRAWVAADGTVHWVPSADDVDTDAWFTLSAMDDGGLSDEISWSVHVGPKRPGPHAAWRESGCTQAPTSAGWLAVGLVALALRRRVRSTGF